MKSKTSDGRGRPPLQAGVSSSTLSTRVPAPMHERVLRLASEQRKSPAQFVRDAVEHFCTEK